MKWARDYLATARDAVLAIRAIDAEYERLRAAVLVGAQKYDADGRSSGIPDPTDAYAALMDYERQMDHLAAPHLELVDDTRRLLHGYRGRGGLASQLSRFHANVLDMRWLQLLRWTDISRMTGRSQRWCQMAQSVAIDWLDCHGENRLRDEIELEEMTFYDKADYE